MNPQNGGAAKWSHGSTEDDDSLGARARMEIDDDIEGDMEAAEPMGMV